MASQNRGSSPDIESSLKSSLRLELLKEGNAFSFFQVMRLLRLMGRQEAKIEESAFIETGNIRVRPKLSLSFPAADVDRIEEQGVDERAGFLVTATFLGLYGSSSPLPTFYTEDLMDEGAADESVARDFIDVINQRLFSLFYRCCIKYRQFLQIVEENNPEHLERLFSLLGLWEKELREDIPDSYRLIRYIGLFTQFPRSALGLKTLLQDALDGIPIKIIPCVKRKAKIPDDQRLFLGISAGFLGMDSFVGEEIEDRMGKFRLRIGPLDQKNFRTFIPGSDRYNKLSFLTKMYIVEPLEYDMELILSKGQAKTVCLGASEWSMLGLTTWIFSGDELEEKRVIF
ncbi:MAG: type VI secretion system baseplate subunit TssG [Desulfobacteraceae bacterium]|nr:type VI secretion system baseplate subunit TssG [Desulfobacteraceae bacterium]MBC2718943.1 type VI secretion system baseplate subunit TssG [Desulfobacteraceae bacterium]